MKPKQRKFKKPKNTRTINVRGNIWYWRVGKSNVVARGFYGEKKVGSFSAVTGRPAEVITREIEKKSFTIHPTEIANWLDDSVVG